MPEIYLPWTANGTQPLYDQNYMNGGRPDGDGTDFNNIWFVDSFENGTLGENSSASLGTYSNHHAKYSTGITAAHGTQCLSDLATLGVSENANGFYWNYPDGVAAAKGDEIWFRVKCWMPLDTDLTTTGYGLKWMRVKTPSGYSDIYLEPNGDWRVTREGIAPDGLPGGWAVLTDDQSHAPVFGTWETYEFYVKLDDVSAYNGGEGRMRFWKNGVLVGDVPNFATLLTDAETQEDVLIRTFWNGSVPATQTWYWDSFAVACNISGYRDDTSSLMLDAGGNRMIGTGD